MRPSGLPLRQNLCSAARALPVFSQPTVWREPAIARSDDCILFKARMCENCCAWLGLALQFFSRRPSRQIAAKRSRQRARQCFARCATGRQSDQGLRNRGDPMTCPRAPPPARRLSINPLAWTWRHQTSTSSTSKCIMKLSACSLL